MNKIDAWLLTIAAALFTAALAVDMVELASQIVDLYHKQQP